MGSVGLVVEGQVDRVAADSILATRGLRVDPNRVIITGGKSRFDARLSKYNQAALLGPWLALRDSDHDAGNCPATLRRTLLTVPQSPAMCLRLVVRTLESWLLSDAEAFSDHFSVPASKVPRDPEGLDRPKDALIKACRWSRRRDVQAGVVPPPGTNGTGPEYTTFISRYCREAWRPDTAASAAPSLRRAFDEIDRLIADGIW